MASLFTKIERVIKYLSAALTMIRMKKDNNYKNKKIHLISKLDLIYKFLV